MCKSSVDYASIAEHLITVTDNSLYLLPGTMDHLLGTTPVSKLRLNTAVAPTPCNLRKYQITQTTTPIINHILHR